MVLFIIGAVGLLFYAITFLYVLANNTAISNDSVVSFIIQPFSIPLFLIFVAFGILSYIKKKNDSSVQDVLDIIAGVLFTFFCWGLGVMLLIAQMYLCIGGCSHNELEIEEATMHFWAYFYLGLPFLALLMSLVGKFLKQGARAFVIETIIVGYIILLIFLASKQ